MNRSTFIRQSAFTLGALGLQQSLLAAPKEQSLVILHTNDVHSRLLPFPMDGGRNQGLGGVAARAALINQIRRENEHVLLLDAGDIFQGTPFFNLYKGEPEIKAMTAMGYDAGTMGNHDFDGGLDNFTTQLQHAKFPIVMSNYDFKGTSLHQVAKPYITLKKGPVKVGILGLGIELQGLVPKNLYQQTRYEDPLAVGNEIAKHLRYTEHCDLIICLSHLGYDYGNNPKICDTKLAAASEDIDLIIGGHTHTFLKEPKVITNRKNRQVIINQVGWGGIFLGRLDITFSGVNKRKFFSSTSIAIDPKS